MLFENKLSLTNGQTLYRVMREKVCMAGFSGKSGIVLSDHAKKRMVDRQVSLEDLMLCVMLGGFEGYEKPSENRTIKFRLVGTSNDGDLIALIVVASVTGTNPRKWVFKLVTLFQYTKEEAASAASFRFLCRYSRSLVVFFFRSGGWFAVN